MIGEVFSFPLFGFCFFNAKRGVIEKEGIDLIVLARYMQILSDDLCRKMSGKIIKPEFWVYEFES